MRISVVKVGLWCGLLVGIGLTGGFGASHLFGSSAKPEITGSVPEAPKAMQAAIAAPPAAAPMPAPPKTQEAAVPAVAPTAPCRSSLPNGQTALGVSRVVEIDTTGGPGFGLEQFKSLDFLRDKEIVLTFDDGPWPGTTPAVLKALADQCTKALFFPIGEHAMWHPDILKQVALAGQTIGSHTWSHADLAKKSPQDAKDEIEKGFSAVHTALGASVSPFFRFPMLKLPQDSIAYLGQRNIAMFSTDVDSWDYKTKKPDDVIKTVMTRLDKKGKGIILMHDLQKSTAQALPELLRQLQAAGYRVVQVKAKDPVATLPDYDTAMAAQVKGAGSAANALAVQSVVRTISEQ